MNTSIYVCHHKPSHILSSDTLVPIQVGKAGSDVDLEIIGDDTGDNISDKNATFCELTAMYWAWKNDTTSTHVGLMHYRRFLDFNEEVEKDFDNHGVHAAGFSSDFEEYYGLTDEKIAEYTKRYDIIVPRPFDVRTMGKKSVADLYSDADHHFDDDLQKLRDLVDLREPEYLPYFDKVLKGNRFHPTNMFIMRRDLFDAYSEWLFGLLFELEDQLNLTRYSDQEARVFGYLSERMFDAWLMKTLRDDPDIKLKELERVHVKDTEPFGAVPPYVPGTVTVAFGSGPDFIDHAHALLASILDNFDFENRRLEIIYLDNGIGEVERNILASQLLDFPKASISFLYMKHTFDNVYVREPFTKVTFYRLALADLLPDRDRVVYLDADVVVNTDLATLYDVDLGDNLVAAVRDFINVAFQRTKEMTARESGNLTADVYAQRVLGLGASAEWYFQAGVLVLNLDAIRQLDLTEQMIREMEAFKYWFLDQDVLNATFKGKVLYLDQAWNVVYLGENLMDALSAEERQMVEESFENPKVVHFAGIAKPWLNELHPDSWLYWKYLRATPKYEHRLKSYIASSASGGSGGDRHVPLPLPTTYRAMRSLYRKVPPQARNVVPKPFTTWAVKAIRGH